MMESEGRKGAVTTKKEKPSAWRKQDPGRICSESWQELTPSPLKNRIEVMAVIKHVVNDWIFFLSHLSR